MIIGVVFVPEVPIGPVDVAVASEIVAADADGMANRVRPAASTKVAVAIEINFLNMRDPLNVTS
jgi:hypothetical protein